MSEGRAPGSRWILLAVAATLLLAFMITRWPSAGGATPQPPEAEAATAPQGAPRVVSLAPAVTETLLALDATEHLVGVSQYCRGPLEALPRVGTAITPQLEAIARLRPTLIVSSLVAGGQLQPLSRLAPTRELPWLHLHEVVASIRELGALVGREQEGGELADRVAQTLSASPPEDAPRVLLVMSYGDTGSNEVWFIRRNSLHGALLHAAGGRNAVAADVAGQPRMSVEELLRTDPEQIVLVVDSEQVSEAEARRRLRGLLALEPLGAVRDGKIGLLRAPNPLSVGPNILDLVEPLRQELERLASAALPTGGPNGDPTGDPGGDPGPRSEPPSSP